ncbi:UPF0175 family protein [Candidatus Poribacteria bacterium]|nr:UPF0175 family protein [Candidatus Poribacteria bacterium]
MAIYKLQKLQSISRCSNVIIDLGRTALALEKYKKGEASLEKAAKIAGVSISKMMDLLKEFNIEINLEYEDYLTGLKNLRKIW